MTPREYWVKNNAAAAVEAAGDSGIYPAVMIAAAILESSGLVSGQYVPGASLLAKNANNYFGIKASPGWTGDTIALRTGEYINGQRVTVTGVFRKYPTVKDSFSDYVNFLQVNPRYRAAGVFSANGAAAQADALQAAGYATDPAYAKKLKSIMEDIAEMIPREIAAAGAGLFFLALIALIYLKVRQ